MKIFGYGSGIDDNSLPNISDRFNPKRGPHTLNSESILTSIRKELEEGKGGREGIKEVGNRCHG